MASFSAGTTFTDGVANDVTAAKLGALVNNATPTSGFIQDRTTETATATNDTLLIGDASDSNNLKRITVANFVQTLPTAKITTGTIETGTFGTTTSTAATITTGTIPTLVSTTLITSGTGTTASPAIVPTGDTNTGVFFPAADTVGISTGGIERFRVASSGNVGIGITAPDATLTVEGSVQVRSTNKLHFSNTLDRATIHGPLSDTLAISTAGTERLRIDSSGNVGIGTTSPSSILHISKTGAAFPSSSNPRIRLDEVSSGRFGVIEFDSSTNLNIWGSDAGSGSIRFFNGTGSGTERLRVDSSGNVLVTNVAGLGYGTGAGGTVTQSTNKATGVTLNKPTGQITTSTATLNANTTVSFVFTNSIIASTDTISINHTSGGTGSSYLAWASGISAGSASINLRNITAGNLSDSLVLNFNVIKGATS